MIRFIIGIIFGILVIIFMVQNPQPAEITFLFWTVSMSRAVMYVIICALGFGAGWLVKKRR